MKDYKIKPLLEEYFYSEDIDDVDDILKEIENYKKEKIQDNEE